MRNSSKKKLLLVIVILLLFGGFLALGLKIGSIYAVKERSDSEESEEEVSQRDYNTVYYDGKAYKYNQNIRNILFLGIDKGSELAESNELGDAGQTDTIMLLSVDRELQTTHLLQISRDTMTEIDIYDKYGGRMNTMDAQIATQYAYGNGKESGCRAAKVTVSELLYDLPIYGYFAMDIAAIPVLNDLAGGVTLTMPEDYTDVDPLFVKGAEVTLDGALAEKYVRYRDTSQLGSNDLRMRRQIHYLPTLFDALQEQVGLSEESLEEIYPILSPYVTSDLTADEMYEMMKYRWRVEDITYLPGESVAGERHEEFHVDDEALQELLIELYYIEQ